MEYGRRSINAKERVKTESPEIQGLFKGERNIRKYVPCLLFFYLQIPEDSQPGIPFVFGAGAGAFVEVSAAVRAEPLAVWLAELV